MRKIFLAYIFLFVTSIAVYAKDGAFSINKIETNCRSEYECSEVINILQSLKRTYSNYEHFYTVFKLFVANEGISELSFEIIQKVDKNLLKLDFSLKTKIVEVEEVSFKGDGYIETPSILPIKTGEFLNPKHVLETKKILSDVAKENGYPFARVEIKSLATKGGVILKPTVRLGKAIIVDKVFITSKSNFLKEKILTKFNAHIGESFQTQIMKLELEEARKLFIQYGYYLVDFTFKYKIKNGGKAHIYLTIENTDRYVFYLDDLPIEEVKDVKKYLAENLTSSRRKLSEDSVEYHLKDYFEHLGYKFPNIKIKSFSFKDLHDEKINSYKISIEKGPLSKVSVLQFRGNSFYSDQDLRKIFQRNAPDLASLKIYDIKYYEVFKEILREKYISNGFLSVFIENPTVQFETKTKRVRISFKIREGIRTNVSKISILGVSSKEESDILGEMVNKVGQSFDPIEFKQDIERVESYLKREGYYFTNITNSSKDDFVRYYSDNSQVELKIKVNKGPKIYVDQIIIIGNRKTRKKLIKRELEISSGSLLTSDSVSKSQSNLLRLGIFSTVRIKPVSNINDKTDILVFVREKDFGVIELAPGVRSDLGLKLSTLVSYNNIDGMNKRITFQGTVNRRFDLNSLDDNRRQSNKKLIEYDTTVNFVENHIFNSILDFTLSGSQARKRFVSFDADIQRISYTVSSEVNDWFAVSIKQQLEVVSQFNSTDETNHGHFQIGSLTPGINMDFRDRRVNPSKGAEFDLSVELANPSFLSQDNDELTINYYKLVSRNKFYIPLSDRVTLAISSSFGVQENLADDDDYIPGIKVFRLSGADIVRGYEDKEINTLIDGNDISKVEVNNKAYMANFKFEPRYMLTDSTIFGLFYDAGRVYVDEFSADDLRSSFGVSFKYVTPVGTLDLDYGIKTLRKTDSSGKLESPGKLHLSIGFF